MSFKIVDDVNKANPELLRANRGSTCYRHTSLVIEALRAAGHTAFLICKSPGEGQYTPPGFQPRIVKGLDGKDYQCSGVSHDAIYCDGKQFDTLGAANEHDRPIYRKSTEPGWSFDPADGSQIIAAPTWNPIAPHEWRPNNPPLKDGVIVPGPGPTPTPQPPAFQLPERQEMMNAGKWFDSYYKSPEGLQRPDGMSINGRPDWEGVGAWLFDVYLAARVTGANVTEATAAVVKAIRQTDEWKTKHPGETP